MNKEKKDAKLREDIKKLIEKLSLHGFWLWEYQRRNQNYQDDYTRHLGLVDNFKQLFDNINPTENLIDLLFDEDFIKIKIAGIARRLLLPDLPLEKIEYSKFSESLATIYSMSCSENIQYLLVWYMFRCASLPIIITGADPSMDNYDKLPEKKDLPTEGVTGSGKIFIPNELNWDVINYGLISEKYFKLKTEEDIDDVNFDLVKTYSILYKYEEHAECIINIKDSYKYFLSFHGRPPKDTKSNLSPTDILDSMLGPDHRPGPDQAVQKPGTMDHHPVGDNFFPENEIDSGNDIEVSWRRNSTHFCEKIGSGYNFEKGDYIDVRFFTQNPPNFSLDLISMLQLFLRFDYRKGLKLLQFDPQENPQDDIREIEEFFNYLNQLNLWRLAELQIPEKGKQQRTTKRSNIARAVGLWIYDYIIENDVDFSTAYEALDHKFGDRLKKRKHKYEENRAENIFNSTLDCIDEVKVLPLLPK